MTANRNADATLSRMALRRFIALVRLPLRVGSSWGRALHHESDVGESHQRAAGWALQCADSCPATLAVLSPIRPWQSPSRRRLPRSRQTGLAIACRSQAILIGLSGLKH